MAEWDDLIVAASVGDDDSIKNLTKEIKATEVQELRKLAEQFDVMFDAWDDAEQPSEAKTELVMALAERDVLESTSFRTALNEAVKFLLPPYLASQAILKSIGVRDTDVQTHEVVLRVRKLQHIRNGALMNMNNSKMWSRITSIEKVTATFSVTGITGGSLNSIPIASGLSAANFFEPHTDMFPLISPNRGSLQPSTIYRKKFAMHALNDLSELKLKDTVQRILVPECLSLEQFEAWWTTDTQTGTTASSRAVWQSRSLLELHELLSEAEGCAKLDEAQTAQLAHIFTGLHVPVIPKNIPLAAECIAMLAEKNDNDALTALFSTIRGKLPFFPAVIRPDMPFAGLEEWAHISVKLLNGFVKVAKLLYSDEELGRLWCRLPQRCMQALFDVVEPKYIVSAICESHDLSADVLMFLWKNYKMLPKDLTSIVDMDNIANALSKEGLAKEWTPAQRSLKRTLFEKKDFQKFVIDNADGDFPSIINALQKVRTFQIGECQSLIVFLSNASDAFKEHIESGKANRLMGENKNVVQDTPISSRLSISRLVKELEHITNVDVPENRAAIAHARSLGDFRENAEYDAAKLRRRELQSRRAQLESILGNIASTDYDKVEIKNKVVLGSAVTLSDATGKESVYYILGAWDGDPEKNRFSYRTPIGVALIDAEVGSKVTLPEIGARTIVAVNALPAALQKELASEV